MEVGERISKEMDPLEGWDLVMGDPQKVVVNEGMRERGGLTAGDLGSGGWAYKGVWDMGERPIYWG